MKKLGEPSSISQCQQPRIKYDKLEVKLKVIRGTIRGVLLRMVNSIGGCTAWYIPISVTPTFSDLTSTFRDGLAGLRACSSAAKPFQRYWRLASTTSQIYIADATQFHYTLLPTRQTIYSVAAILGSRSLWSRTLLHLVMQKLNQPQWHIRMIA